MLYPTCTELKWPANINGSDLDWKIRVNWPILIICIWLESIFLARTQLYWKLRQSPSSSSFVLFPRVFITNVFELTEERGQQQDRQESADRWRGARPLLPPFLPFSSPFVGPRRFVNFVVRSLSLSRIIAICTADHLSSRMPNKGKKGCMRPRQILGCVKRWRESDVNPASQLRLAAATRCVQPIVNLFTQVSTFISDDKHKWTNHFTEGVIGFVKMFPNPSQPLSD